MSATHVHCCNLTHLYRAHPLHVRFVQQHFGPKSTTNDDVHCPPSLHPEAAHTTEASVASSRDSLDKAGIGI